MPAFNYRNLIRQIPPLTWQLYFASKSLSWPEGLDLDAPGDGWADIVEAALDDLPEDEQRLVYRDLRRVHALGNRPGVDALRNSVALGATMLEDFEHHSSDAERALWALVNSPEFFEKAEAFRTADALVGYRTWKRIYLEPPLTLHTTDEDREALRHNLRYAFTPRKGRKHGKLRAGEVDFLYRHLDGALQIDLRIEDDGQLQQEFGPDDKTIWRTFRPPVYLTVLIYPENGMIDLLVPGGESARKKVIKAIGKHVLRQRIEPLDRPPPVFLLNRLREGAKLDPDSDLDLLAHGVEALRFSECKVRAMFSPRCDYAIKPPGEKLAPDVAACLAAHHTTALVGPVFNIVEAVISLYFFPTDGAKKRPPLHLHVRPDGISHLNELSEADAKLAEAVVSALGILPMVPAATVVATPEPEPLLP